MQLKQYITLKSPLIIICVILAYRLLYVELFLSLDGSGVSLPSAFDIPVLAVVCLAAFLAVRYLNKYLPYGCYSVLRFSFELLYLILSSGVVAIGFCFSQIVNGEFTDLLNSGTLGIIFLSVLLMNTVVLYLFNLRLYYRDRHRAALAEQISAKNHANYQYNQLKRQLDPHFLFNSLSVLDSLVDIDGDRAHRFINKLSEVYRYLLSCQDKTQIGLDEEIKFAESYISLMQERFGESICYHNSIEPAQYSERLMIPFSLQILFENAIKHNVVSATSPLQITVTIEDSYIVVTNNINPKIGIERASTGIGLRYITVRYAEFSDNEVVVEKLEGLFTVKLPLLSKTIEQ